MCRIWPACRELITTALPFPTVFFHISLGERPNNLIIVSPSGFVTKYFARASSSSCPIWFWKNARLWNLQLLLRLHYQQRHAHHHQSIHHSWPRRCHTCNSLVAFLSQITSKYSTLYISSIATAKFLSPHYSSVPVPAEVAVGIYCGSITLITVKSKNTRAPGFISLNSPTL